MSVQKSIKHMGKTKGLLLQRLHAMAASCPGGPLASCDPCNDKPSPADKAVFVEKVLKLYNVVPPRQEAAGAAAGAEGQGTVYLPGMPPPTPTKVLPPPGTTAASAAAGGIRSGQFNVSMQHLKTAADKLGISVAPLPDERALQSSLVETMTKVVPVPGSVSDVIVQLKLENAHRPTALAFVRYYSLFQPLVGSSVVIKEVNRRAPLWQKLAMYIPNRPKGIAIKKLSLVLGPYTAVVAIGLVAAGFSVPDVDRWDITAIYPGYDGGRPWVFDYTRSVHKHMDSLFKYGLSMLDLQDDKSFIEEAKGVCISLGEVRKLLGFLPPAPASARL